MFGFAPSNYFEQPKVSEPEPELPELNLPDLEIPEPVQPADPMANYLTGPEPVVPGRSQVEPAAAPEPASAAVPALEITPDATVPASDGIAPDETLAEIEASVHSPHLDRQKAEAGLDYGVSDARDAVQAALNSVGQNEVQQPIEALNAQAFGAELHTPEPEPADAPEPAAGPANPGFSEPTPGTSPADETLDMPLPAPTPGALPVNPFGPAANPSPFPVTPSAFPAAPQPVNANPGNSGMPPPPPVPPPPILPPIQ